MSFKGKLGIFTVCICLSILYGCSMNSNDNKSFCTIDNDGIVITAENFAENGTVIKTIQTTKMSNEKLNSIGRSYIENNVNQYKELYNIQGVEYKFEFNDSENEAFVEELTIDYEQASYDDLVRTGLITESPDNNKDINLEKTIKLFELQGYSCD